MNQASERKEENREKLLAGIGQSFRRHGFGGIGVDGLAKAAGVTSGAFYSHFKSKADSFREAAAAGLANLRAGIERMRSESGSAWHHRFVAFYMSERRTCALEQSCALQSMTADVVRADMPTRRAYTAELQAVIDAAAAGLDAVDSSKTRGDAIALLALLSGGVSMARAVDDPALAEEIARAVENAAIRARAASA